MRFGPPRALAAEKPRLIPQSRSTPRSVATRPPAHRLALGEIALIPLRPRCSTPPPPQRPTPGAAARTAPSDRPAARPSPPGAARHPLPPHPGPDWGPRAGRRPATGSRGRSGKGRVGTSRIEMVLTGDTVYGDWSQRVNLKDRPGGFIHKVMGQSRLRVHFTDRVRPGWGIPKLATEVLSPRTRKGGGLHLRTGRFTE